MEEPKALLPNGHSDSHTEDKPEQMEVDEVESKMKDDLKTDPKRTKSTDSDGATNSSPKNKTTESDKATNQSFENALMQIEKSSIKKKVPQKIVKRSPRISRNREPPEKDGEASGSQTEVEDKSDDKSSEKVTEEKGKEEATKEVKKEAEESEEVATNKEKKEAMHEVERKEAEADMDADSGSVKFSGDPDADFLGFDDPKKSNYNSARDKLQKMIDQLMASTSGSSRSRRSTTVKRSDSTKEVESEQSKAGTSETKEAEPETGAVEDENRSRRSRPSLAAQSERKPSPITSKRNYDVSLPQYLKPFDYGWKRELAYRNNTETSSKRMADVFYYTPLGKKIRSIGAVKDYLLGTDLTLENFTFVTKSMNLNDPNKETIRDPRKNIIAKPPTPQLPPLMTRKQKANSADSAAAAAADNAEDSSTPKAAAASPLSTPKISLKSFRPPPKNKANKTPVPEKKSKKSSDDSDNDKDELEMGMLPPLWNESIRPDWSANGSTTMNTKSEKSAAGNVSKRQLPEPETEIAAAVSSPPPAKRSKKEAAPEVVAAPAAAAAPEVTSPKAVTPVPVPVDPAPDVKEAPAKACAPAAPVASSSVSVNKDFFMTNVSAIYHALLNSFQYLKVQELLRAARVCHMWRDVALNRSLWHVVRLKNSRVRDWDGLAATLRQTGTRHLDLRKMLMPPDETAGDMWTRYAAAVDRLNSLWRVDLCRCPAAAVERTARANPRLQCAAALAIKSSSLDVSAFENCRNMTELRLKSSEKNGLDLENLSTLKHLTKMKHLSLTTVKTFKGDQLTEALENMKDLETLELGECCELNASVASKALAKLKRLQRLRLEKGQGAACPTLAILETCKELKSLVQLELINFDIKSGFDTTIAKCTNLRTLLIIPTYVTQSATTNHLVMEGVSKLSKTLTLFVWGITLELLRVTDLFIDQWEGQKGATGGKSSNSKKGGGDSIPILKPLSETSNKEAGAPSQVDILQLPKLHKVLTSLLPTTKVKILKVPFSATWRQTVSGPAHIH